DLGHVDLTRLGSNRVRQDMNWIVHFADPQSADSPQLLLDALASSSKKGSAVLVVAVVSPEQLAKMAPLPVNIENAALAWADDMEGVWRKTFAAEATPATYIVRATGQIVWRQMGKSDPSILTAAFDEHLMSGGQLGWQMLQLAVQAGEPAPDFLFEYESGQEIALRKLRGRPVLVTFWKWWSPSCLSELQALQKLHDTTTNEGLIVLAIHDGEDQEQAPALFKEQGFTFRLILDTARNISNLYGVCGWPTTMSIDEDGVVDGIQFGLA
ncbi:MAG TPA: TlpA disulfide reductase family protein, partial [Blastocatellia bacterium]